MIAHKYQLAFEDAVAFRFKNGQSLARIRRIYRVRRIDVEQALRSYANRRRQK
jgi:hypothetical protein